MALEHWLRLSLTQGLGPILTGRLVDALGSAEAACNADQALLASVEGIGTARARSIAASLKQSPDEASRELDRAASADVRIISRDDDEYPPLLKTIPDPPLVLYVRGTIEPRDLHGIAIVGSRKCSFYGREQAERFAALMSAAGITVLSGGARGVDSSAHRGAMQPANGRTIAVLGSGLDVIYPAENASLFDQIADGRGAVLSEYAMGTRPLAENFPRRNRIVSGMSRGVLVVEADVRSGALITARQAADDHNRPVFALPGRIDNPLSAGPHALIRDGATLVTSLEDILDELGPLPELVKDESATAIETPVTIEPTFIDPAHRAILEQMDDSPITVDELIDRTGTSASHILRELTLMSLKGLVKRVDGQRYQRGRKGTA